MGTRADFYVGRGTQAEWVGSIAWDGYPTGIAGVGTMATGDVTACPILNATDEAAFREAVLTRMGGKQDWTPPDRGWPWPWETSHTTDFAYAFEDGQVHASCFGSPWFDPTRPRPADAQEPDARERIGPAPEFPNMSARQRVTLGPRSGVIVVRG